MFLHIYKAKHGWTWKVFNNKKKVMAKSTIYYKRSSDAKKAFEKLDRMF